MVIRETTDRQSPLALEQYGAGIRVPMLTSAAGRAYLAYCTPQQRETLLELLARSSLPEDRLVRSRVEIERILNETPHAGFRNGSTGTPCVRGDQLGHSGPSARARAGDHLRRYAATAVPLRTATEQVPAEMREAVAKIEREFASI